MLLASLALLLLQTPIKLEKHPELGLEFPRPAAYDPVPTQPTERDIVLYYAERASGPKRSQPSFAAETRGALIVLWFEPIEPATAAAEPGAKAAAERHASLRSWVEDRMPGWDLRPKNDRPSKKGWEAQEYSLTPPRGVDLAVTGFAFTWTGADRTIAFVAVGSSDEYTRMYATWLRAAQNCVITEPREASTAEAERRYARTTLREVPHRLDVRRRLLRGWGVEDTDDYLVVHHTQDLAMVRRVASNIEVVRAEYARLFPPRSPIRAIGIVRICRDREEYLAYGGPADTAGYWNPDARELVLYDAEKDPENRRKGDAATFLALYHEAFHQYVHYAAGELAPHSWFDEGWGDYFSGARVQGGKLVEVDPHPWRVDLVREAVAKNATVPLADLLRLEQAEFYAPGAVAVCYAQAWSFVWFLRRSERVAAEPSWSGLLDRYYAALCAAWEAQGSTLPAGDAGSAARDAAAKKARETALAAALVGVDVAALESAWKDHVRAER